MKKSEEIRDHLNQLRKEMEKEGVDTLMIPTADYHNSEYAAEYFAARKYYSGFTGSAGTLIVSKDWAGLWTDGRYWIQAEREMKDTGIALMKMAEPGVPDTGEYLEQTMKDGEVLGFDGRCVSYEEGHRLKKALKVHGVQVSAKKDLAGKAWKHRPELPCHPMFVLEEKYVGESSVSKVRRLREALGRNGAQNLVITKLDDIMWLTNLRGADVDYNPVALSYAVVTPADVHLFVQPEEVTDQVRTYCRETGISMDPGQVSYRIFSLVKKRCELADVPVIREACPIELMKAVKNATEIRNTKEIYLEDSVKVTDFIFWLTHKADLTKETELSAAQYLDHLRTEIPGFLELSFGTIAAYGANAAQMHYDPSKQAPAQLAPEGMLLVDSGGTYTRGTTDVTRTTALRAI